jgi:hypothetical protein
MPLLKTKDLGLPEASNCEGWVKEFQRARVLVTNRDLISGVLDGFDLLHEFVLHVNTCDRPMHEEIEVRTQQQPAD